VARAIDLGATAARQLGIQCGRRRRTAILADVCEALIGAVFIDGGYPAAAALIERLWRERMLTPPAAARSEDDAAGVGAGRGLPTPAYREVERTGPHHNPDFRVRCDVPALQPAEGSAAPSARRAGRRGRMLTREGVVDGCGDLSGWPERRRAAASSR
jgi:ribonuclease-3